MLYLRTPADEHLRRLDNTILDFDDWQRFTHCRPLRIGRPADFVLSVARYGVLVVPDKQKTSPLGALCASAVNKSSNYRRDAEFAENFPFAQSGDGDWAKTPA